MADDAYRRRYHTEARMAAEDGSPAGPCRVLVAAGKLAPGLARMPVVPVPEDQGNRLSYGGQVRAKRPPCYEASTKQRQAAGRNGGRAKAARMKGG